TSSSTTRSLASFAGCASVATLHLAWNRHLPRPEISLTTHCGRLRATEKVPFPERGAWSAALPHLRTLRRRPAPAESTRSPVARGFRPPRVIHKICQVLLARLELVPV